MKRLLVLTPLLAVALVAGAGDVQAGFEVTAGGGAGVPVGDFSDGADPGWGIGASIGTSLMPMISWGLDAGYHKFGSPDDADDLESSAFRGSGFIKINPPLPSLAPYAKGMAGLYRFKREGTLPLIGDVDEANTDFGVAAGAGLQLGGAGPAKGFVEGLFHHVMTEDRSSQFIEIRAGVAIGLGVPGPM